MDLESIMSIVATWMPTATGVIGLAGLVIKMISSFKDQSKEIKDIVSSYKQQAAVVSGQSSTIISSIERLVSVASKQNEAINSLQSQLELMENKYLAIVAELEKNKELEKIEEISKNEEEYAKRQELKEGE